MYTAPKPTEVYEAMHALFAAAAKCDRKVVWNAIFASDPELDPNSRPGFKCISNFVAYEYHEFTRCVFELKDVLERTLVRDSRVRLMLAIYCHIMEGDFPMAVIWNLLRAVNGQPERWTFRSEGGSVCEYPGQKIKTIKNLSEKLGMRIGDVLDHLWCGRIRNAFSHSKYYIIADYVVLTKGLSPISRKKMGEHSRGGGNPSVSDIESLYVASDAFIASFMEEYYKAQEPFRKAQQPDLT